MFDNIFNKKINHTKLYRTPEEALYNGLILNERNGTYPAESIKKKDGSLKPMNFLEASEKDRFKVFYYIKER